MDEKCVGCLIRPTLGAKVAVIMCNIVRHWQFSKKSSVRRWAKLCDIERHWATLDKTEQQYPDNVKYYNSQIMHLHRKYNSKYQNIF